MNFHEGIFAQPREKQYATINPRAIMALRRLHFESHWPSLCRKTMLEMLFKEELKFTMNKKDIYTSEVTPLFRELLRGYYIPFLQDCYDELMILGIVVVKIIKGPTNDLIPEVVSSQVFGKYYELRIYSSYETGQPIYKVYKLISKKTGQPLGEPKEDKSAFVFNTLLKGPDIDGVIQSPTAALMSVQMQYDLMMQCNMLADYNLSDPTILTETQANAANLSAMESGTPMYAPDDPIADLQGVREQDSANRTHVLGHINAQMDSPDIWYPDGTWRLKKHIHNNVVAVPIGHKIVHGAPLPQRRNDLEHRVRNYENDVCAAYGIDRGFLVQETSFKTAGASEVLESRIRMSLILWSARLSEIMTSTLRCIYYNDDCNYLFGKLKAQNKDNLPIETLLNKAKQLADVQVILPVSPAVDLQEISMLYDRGVVTWEEYVIQSRTMKGLVTTTIPPEPPKPEEADGSASAQPPPKKKQRVEL